MNNTRTHWISKHTHGLVALVVALGFSTLRPVGLDAQDPDTTDTCWSKCALEASLWMYENDKTEEEAEEYFELCYSCCWIESHTD